MIDYEVKRIKKHFFEDHIFIHNKNKLLGEGIGLSNDLIEKFGDFEVLAITINPYEDGVIDIKINYFEYIQKL